jgi:hypothetical protein
MKLENLNVISKITKKAYNNRRDLLKKKSLGVFQKIKTVNGEKVLHFKTIATFNDRKSYDMFIKVDEKWKNAKIHCTCDAFHFQGFQYKLTQLDAAIYEEKRPDKHWRKYHKNATVCKHLFQTIKYILAHRRDFKNKLRNKNV